MLGPELSRSLRLCGGGKDWRQGFAGKSMPLAQISGVADAAGGFGAAGQRPVGHRVRKLATQFFGGGLLLELIDQGMLTGAQPPSHHLVAFQQGEPLPGAQHPAIEADDVLECGVQRVTLRGEHFSIKNGRTHTSKLNPPTDEKPHSETTETNVAHEISPVCAGGDCRSEAGKKSARFSSSMGAPRLSTQDNCSAIFVG